MNMTTVVRPEIVSQIGNTPLVELNSFSTSNVKLFAKLEWFNPFGSVKDRAA
jgi:S-sulfo-L-cysteine synthase (O-acetyl-L-serine-dependent)